MDNIKKELEIFCYCISDKIDYNDLVIPPIKGIIIGKRMDGRVEFKVKNGDTVHYVYPQQLRESKNIK